MAWARKDEELDMLPKGLFAQLSRATLWPYAARLRAERNTARNLYQQARERIARLERELADARDACKRYAKAIPNPKDTP